MNEKNDLTNIIITKVIEGIIEKEYKKIGRNNPLEALGSRGQMVCDSVIK